VRRVFLLVALAAGLAGCGGEARGPESVVEAWSDAVNDGDNERAARLFADEAQVVQGGRTLVFHDRSEARAWNAALPCSGRILKIDAKDDLAEATFVLADRGETACDAPGATARVLVRVRDGKIVLWHQLASDEPSQVV
jgi:limonene-1,2-epoxide hydrolase